MSGPDDVAAADLTFRVVRALAERGLTLATAESLTGGGLTAELTRVPGASAVVVGGAIVYATGLKHTLLGVDADLLEREGPVHPEVARQLAAGARTRLAVDGRATDLGVSTTGVAGPDAQGGRTVGTVYVGIASADGVRAVELRLSGDRQAIRSQTVAKAVRELAAELGIASRPRSPGNSSCCSLVTGDCIHNKSPVVADIVTDMDAVQLASIRFVGRVEEGGSEMILVRQEIGDVLRDFRLQKGRTLRQVASKASVALGYLSEVERGQKEASSEILASVADALETPVSVIMREVGDRIAVLEGLEPVIPDTIPDDFVSALDANLVAR